MTHEQRTAIIAAVESAKASHFGVTAIKVELEAQLDRTDEDNEYCDSCEEGEIYDSETDEYLPCEECDGSGYISTGEGVYSEERSCYDFILSKLVPYGLATPIGDGAYTPVKPLVFARFYNDGSVDSEFTFTLSLEDPQTIFLLPKVVEAFTALADEIGNGMQVRGAGMHTAFLNHPECAYGSRHYTDVDFRAYGNFQRSLTPLLPALYFLAASNADSRQLSYRMPRVSDDDKYSAIALRYGALEFRVFDTCYDTPEQILDNVVVMSNTLKYYSPRYQDPRLDRVLNGQRLYFGNDENGESLSRFYTTTTHLDVLRRGLKLLKPSYRTVRELKAQRGFKVTKPAIRKQTKQVEQSAAMEYEEYANRNSWLRNVVLGDFRNDYMRQYIHSHPGIGDATQHFYRIMHDIVEPQAQAQLAAWETQIIDKDTFIKDRITKYLENIRGPYQLA